MKGKLLIFLAGLLIGAAGVVSYQLLTANVTSLDYPGVPLAHQQQLTAALERNKKLAYENGQLTAELLNLKSAAVKPAAADAAATMQLKDQRAAAREAWANTSVLLGGTRTNDQRKAMAQLTETLINHQVNKKVSALKLRLKLTDQQEQAVRDLLNRQAHDKLSKKDMATATAPVNVEAELKNLLAPEQYAEYQNYQNDEQRTQAEMLASFELAQLSSALQLSEPQKDQVFNILYQQNISLISSTGPTPSLQERLEAERAALRSVLTPEQMTIYEKQRDSQREVNKAFNPSAHAAPPPPVVSPAPSP